MKTKMAFDHQEPIGTMNGGNSDELPPECAAYEALVRELETRAPSEADFDRLAAHESSCPSGIHSEEGVERDLGLPSGALRHGSPDHGLPSAKEVVGSLIRKYLSGKNSLANP